ncbi:zinc-binding dehydrogenase [Streptomyces sp. NRRL S-340]|uniref:zinc-binding dehydrogenase n=1 Tax=Streptomyces sp. NRRL S-340 TaxID=1463901 RepID=UPI00055D9CBB|nr:zinc-binding dehydrogenase [Streptomyces sp. NRRL S-340]
MKAIEIRTFGGPEGLSVVELPEPVPAAGQVVIATEAVGVGGVDTLIRSGALASYGFAEGHIPGGEVAGTVTAVGAGVDASWIGRRVWGFTGTGGGYVERALAPAEQVLPLPAGLSSAAAVTLGSAGAVARFGLRHAHFAPGERVLVRGAAGSIGIMTVQLAARAGAAAVAVTTSSAERGERLRRLGATLVLDRSGESGADVRERAGASDGAGAREGAVTPEGAGAPEGAADQEDAAGPEGTVAQGAAAARAAAAASEGYDVIIDVVAGKDMPSFFDRLNPNGRMVAVGAVGGRPPADFGTRIMTAFQKSISFAAFSAATVPQADLRAARGELFASAARGEIEAVVHELLPLDEAALAHRKMDAGEVFGRIVLTP